MLCDAINLALIKMNINQDPVKKIFFFLFLILFFLQKAWKFGFKRMD